MANTATVTLSRLGQAALEYRQGDRSVFPVQLDKKPYVKWKDYQTRLPAPEEITRWWQQWPQAGIGLATGPISRVVVLDVDGPDGLALLREHHLVLPTTRTVKTGRGWHYYFQDPGVWTKNFTAGHAAFPLPHVDFRGVGGYVVLPPSPHASGAVYTWQSEAPIEDLPNWLREMVIEPPTPSPRPVPVQNGHQTSRLAERILSQALQRASDGTRNETGLWLACQLRDNGLSETEAEPYLIQYAATVRNRGGHQYLESEALESCQAAYSRTPREPWTSTSSHSSGPSSPGGPSSTPEREKPLDHQKNASGPSGPAPEFPPVPGYRVGGDGVFEIPVDETKPETRLTLAPCGVLAHCRDGGRQNWGAFLRWIDRDGHVHEVAVPVGRFHEAGGTLPVELANAGLPIMPGMEKKLLRYFANGDPRTRYRAAIQPGWQEETGVFVLPQQSLGGPPKGERVVYQPERYSPTKQSVCTGGTREKWERLVAAPCAENPILVFWLSSALAAPLLHLLGLEGGGFHLYGTTSQGKTTAEQVAASVWGDGTDPAEGRLSTFVRKWNLTKNATEGLAEAHSDLPLCLDEVGEADARDFGRTIYQLAGGQGKGRMRADATLKPVKVWRTLMLSTGEVATAEVVESEGRRLKGGQSVRLVDIPATHPATGAGIFTTLHDAPTPAALADTLKRACGTHYGWAGPAFVEALIAEGLSAVRAELRAALDATAETLRLSGDAPEVGRVLKRLAVVAVAGEKAIALGLVPWTPGEAVRAVKEMKDRYIHARGGTGGEPERLVECLKSFLLANASSRFRALDQETETVYRLAGYRDANTGTFYLTPDGFREACGGHDVKDVARLLVRRNLLRTPDARHLTERVSVPGVGRTRLYAVSDEILDEEPVAPGETGPLDHSRN